jgi:tetratricopeptide (TPR) repeat protein
LKKAVELHPKHVIAHDNLGTALAEAGELAQACEALKQALALIPETAPQFASRKQNLEQMEALLRLEADLAEIVKGERKPKTFQEGLQLGKVCRVNHHYRTALRYYEQALTNDPDAAKKLAPINVVMLARVAVLASAGKGNDPPPAADRSKYRAKALAWLQQFVKTQREALAKDLSANRYSCQLNLRVLLLHTDLASVRPPALNGLPADERKDWENFWNEVDTLLDKADALTPDSSTEGGRKGAEGEHP